MANEKQDEYIQDINNSGNHLLKLINDILDVTAIEEGKLDLQDNRMEIASLADEILGRWGHVPRRGMSLYPARWKKAHLRFGEMNVGSNKSC